MFSLKLEANGQSVEDLEDALETALAQVRNGMTSGFDRGDGRSYFFEVNETNPNEEEQE